jgi:PAS domain S-box-containing protein
VIAPGAQGQLEVLAAPQLQSDAVGSLNRQLQGIDPSFALGHAARSTTDEHSALEHALDPKQHAELATAIGCSTEALQCQPIIGERQQVLGLLTLIAVDPQSHLEFARELLETGTELAALVLETRRLQQYHRILLEALSQANTGIVIARRQNVDDFRIRYVNQGFEALTGYLASEVLGRNCRLLQGEDRDQPERETIRSALAAGERCQVTLRNYRKDGTLFWNSLNLAPLCNSKGEVTHYVGVQQDVSAIREALERVSRSEAMLNEAQAIAHLGNWNLDYRSGEVTWSDETYRLLGYAPQSLPAGIDAVLAVVHPDDRAELKAELEAAPQRADGTYRVECRFNGADGITRQVLNQGHVIFDDQGRAQRLVGTSLDVTRQRRVEEALREQRERYRLVIDNLEDLIVRSSPRGYLEFVSPSYCRLFGHEEAELIGQRFLPRSTSSDPSAAGSELARLYRPPHVHRSEDYMHTGRGWRWLQWVDRAILDSGGACTGIVSLGRDITEQKLAELDLQQRERLEHELLQLATAFALRHDDGLESLIDQTLEQVGAFTGSDRAYLFRVDDDGSRMSNSHEWCADGIEPMISHLQHLPIDYFSASIKMLSSGEPVVIGCVAELGEDWRQERETLEFQGIQSVLLVPLLEAGRLDGFIGFDAVNGQRTWLASEVRFLQVIASLMVGAFARERVYRDLVQSQRRYEQLARLSRSMAWEIDTLGVFTYVSPVSEDLIGFRPQELVGSRAFYDLFPDTEREQLRSVAFEHFEQARPFVDFVNPLCHRDGRLIWTSTHGVPFFGDDGSLAGYRGIDIDITERHHAQELLRDSEARLSAIFDHAPIGIATLDRDGHISLSNQTFARLLALEPADVLGTAFERLTHPQDRTHERTLFNEMIAEQRNAYRVTLRLLKHDGSILWGELWMLLIPGDAADPVALAMLEDVSEVHLANERREALELALNQYTQQLEALVDLSGRQLPAEEEIRELLALGCRGLQMACGELGVYRKGIGYSRDTLVDATERSAPVHATETPHIDQASLQALLDQPGIPLTADAEAIVDRCERTGWCSTLGLALPLTTPDDGDNILLVLFWSRHATPDLSNLHRELVRLIGQRLTAVRFEERVRHFMMVAKERETIGHLASGIAHDFNNLLGIIDANLHFLESTQTELPASAMVSEFREVLAETRSALGHAKVITSGMLSLSRAGDIHVADTLLEPVIDELIRILRHILPQRINLSVQLEPGIRAKTNASFLQSALLNLALNARDAMPDGGRLKIKAQHQHWDASAALRIGTLAAGDYVELSLSDTGSGMDHATLEQLFEPLFSTKAKQRGHGLGLFMVQEFVQRSGAGLQVASHPGQGSVFRLFLPQPSHGAEPQDMLPRAPRTASQSPPRVLVVDDDPRVRDSISRLLASEAIPFELAEDADSCLRQLADGERFDVILSDLAMPRIDGVSLCQQLQEDYPNLRIILMTGQDVSAFDLDQLAQAPEILQKPIDVQRLRQVLLGT